MILLIVSSFLFSRQFVLGKERPDDRENLRRFIRQADNKNISWAPSNDSRLHSKHFLDGKPTILNRNPTVFMGYDKNKIKQLFYQQFQGIGRADYCLKLRKRKVKT